MSKRKWTEKQLRYAVQNSTSIRQVIQKLGLIPAGGNYDQIQKYIAYYKINTEHFKGQGWNKGLKFGPQPIIPLNKILIKTSTYTNSHRLKTRLFIVGLKKQQCEKCGWAQKSKDGRIPVELDHINGDKHDNRIKNLRILCPNCHSLEPTHRGKNKKKW